MNLSLEFYFSLATIAVSLGGAVYLFFEWLRHREVYKLPLFLGIGLFLIYIYKFPSILSNAGVEIVVPTLNSFFAASFLLSFIGQVVIYLGIASMAPLVKQNKFNVFLFCWAAFSAFFFFAYFRENSFLSVLPIWVTIFLFFLPLQAIIFWAVLRWFKRFKKQWPSLNLFGIKLTAAALIMQISALLFYLFRLVSYPPELWYIAVTSTYLISLIELIAIIFLVSGFVMAHRNVMNHVR